ncbi:uncharacterized protein B0I36DRAFT_354572 [Microdochium trichocladiopsis]|uniref:Secreted protein n=1 Tax=Microdochium trichocladiopsis TaxID=1682393 RepID=A0A9P8XUE0_9PEZI|nr:uncharacterized protein B0I36DRAFT_354572 [Microdochium trichocladiopsis]KAH7018278.1 hypothetical protein B0I36DRAFT_354572 [Microdochium trichocladiopsis]
MGRRLCAWACATCGIWPCFLSLVTTASHVICDGRQDKGGHFLENTPGGEAIRPDKTAAQKTKEQQKLKMGGSQFKVSPWLITGPGAGEFRGERKYVLRIYEERCQFMVP